MKINKELAGFDTKTIRYGNSYGFIRGIENGRKFGVVHTVFGSVEVQVYPPSRMHPAGQTFFETVVRGTLEIYRGERQEALEDNRVAVISAADWMKSLYESLDAARKAEGDPVPHEGHQAEGGGDGNG